MDAELSGASLAGAWLAASDRSVALVVKHHIVGLAQAPGACSGAWPPPPPSGRARHHAHDRHTSTQTVRGYIEEG